MLYLQRISVAIGHHYLSRGVQIMQQQQAEHPAEHAGIPAAEDAGDCLQCLILMYGEIRIDTLAQLLNLTAYAETEFSWLRMHRLCCPPRNPPSRETFSAGF